MMMKLINVAVVTLLAAPATNAWALIDDPNPPSNCSHGDNLNYYLYGYRAQDEQYDRQWNAEGCNMLPQEPRANSNPQICNSAGRQEAYDDWLAFLDENCSGSGQCEQDGRYAGYILGDELCNGYPTEKLLCTELAKMHCEQEAIWYIIYNISNCRFDLSNHANYIRNKIDELCQQGTSSQCIDNESDLRERLRTASDGEVITLCPGRILVPNEISSPANDIHIKCKEPGLCTLEQQRRGRILNLTGDGIVLESLSFKNGRVNNQNGGAVYLQGQYNKVIDCSFESNQASNGGALYVWGSIEITGSRFIANRADRIGGAAYLRNNNVTINNNTGSRNSARRCAGFYYASSGSCRHLAGS